MTPRLVERRRRGAAVREGGVRPVGGEQVLLDKPPQRPVHDALVSRQSPRLLYTLYFILYTLYFILYTLYSYWLADPEVRDGPPPALAPPRAAARAGERAGGRPARRLRDGPAVPPRAQELKKAQEEVANQSKLRYGEKEGAAA